MAIVPDDPVPDATPATAAALPGADRTALDVSHVAPDAGTLRLLKKISGPREPGFAAVIQRSALDAVHAHGQSDTSVEICGVLVGDLHHDRISPYLLISAQIPGEKAASKQTQVTFTADTWNAIQATMETKYADKKIVGWYHTHPGFGVFLSGMDLFIQDNFFNLPHQVAWVYDPIAEVDGVFVWRKGQSDKSEFLIEEDQGERTHDFRAKLPESKRPSIVTERELRRLRWRRWAMMFFVFAGFMIATWYALELLNKIGIRVRLPFEW